MQKPQRQVAAFFILVIHVFILVMPVPERLSRRTLRQR